MPQAAAASVANTVDTSAANPAAQANRRASVAPDSIQCFKPGRHLALSGDTVEFAESDLAATAGAYNPALHEAPLVVGHPSTDGPAYGWVGALAHQGGALEALPRQVNPQFAELVNAGAYKKVSAAFWAPDAPGNPVPGVFYLRHVGFLGAAAPAVKGLRSPQFAADETGVVEFAEWADVDNASLWRGLRDWLLGKYGAEDADRAVPAYLVASVERGAQQDLADTNAVAAASPAPAFANPSPTTPLFTPTETPVTPAEKQALEAENARLKQQLADQADANRKARTDAAHAEALAFADGLVASTVLPVDERDVVVATLDAVAAQADTAGKVLHFGEGTAAKPLLPALRLLLGRLAPRVATGQMATAANAAAGNAGTVAFAAPPGAVVDPARLAQHERALAYQRGNPGTDYVAACRAVGV